MSLNLLTNNELSELLPFLTPQERAEMDLLLATAKTPVWTPLPGPQTAAFYSEADELFYGGAAGGGKSDLLLGMAGTQHWRSIIFRRIFPSVRALIERSREIFNAQGSTHAKDSFNESLHLWRLASGAQVEFGSIQYEKDKEVYRGRPYDFYGFDEITEFSESQYRFVTAWNRSVRPGQRCRVGATGNPPTSSEGQWIIRYWSPWLDDQHPNPAEPGELRWFARLDDQDVEVESGTSFDHNGETIYPRSRTFIPAKLKDNPILEATGYAAVLQGLPEPLRSQVLYGDFTIGMEDNPWQVIPTEWIRAAQKRWNEGERPAVAMRALGVDVARGGRDETIIARLYGTWFDALLKHPGTSTPDGPTVAKYILEAQQDGAAIFIDPVGVGSSPLDVLRSMNVRIEGVNAGAGTAGLDKTQRFGFANVRAEMYWRLREALDPTSGLDLCLPPDRELLADLSAPRWKPVARGIQVEKKDDLKERLGRSPDAGDAVAIAWYGASQPSAMTFVDFVETE